MEIEANAFAMALLMPLPLLKKEFIATKTLSVDAQTKELAKRFKVSPHVMAARLLSLGMLL